MQVAEAALPSTWQALGTFGLVPPPVIVTLFVCALVAPGFGLAYLLRVHSTAKEDADA